MARKDRLLPPVALKIVDYDAEYMEQHHKRIYKSFLSMRQKIGTEFRARAQKTTVNSIEYYESYNLKNNIADGTDGYDLMKWHGMSDEALGDMITFHNSNDLERFGLKWKPRRVLDTVFFNTVESTLQVIIGLRYGTYTEGGVETDLVRPRAFTNEEIGVWNLYFGLKLFNIVSDAGEFQLTVNTALRTEIITNVEAGNTISFLPLVDPVYIINQDKDRVDAAIEVLIAESNFLFVSPDPIEVFGVILSQDTLMDVQAFENVSQDNFFDVYSPALFVDWKIDESWWERFIGGLLKFIGNVLNLILDILISTPLVGKVLEWLIEGVASLFGMTLEEARAAIIQAIVFIIALYFSIPSGGSSMYAYVQWVSSAYSLGGIAGELAAATYESPVGTIEEDEEEKLKRELENMQGELNLILGREEPQIRLNRPEEELRVDGGNNSTYNIFRLD